MSKYPCKKCKGQCCYNVPFGDNELVRFADKIITPVIETERMTNGAILPLTAPDVMENKCPFLTHNYKCNIYDNRPEVCRLFGEIETLPCPMKKKTL